MITQEKTVITDIIIAVKTKNAEGYDIIVYLDRNEAFTSGKGGI